MAIKSVGPDPANDDEVGARGYNDARYALKSDVGAGSAESILTQLINTQLTSAVLTALTSGGSTKVGAGHSVTATGITVPAGTYEISNQVEFNNVAARTLTYVGVRAVGAVSGTTDYLATVMPAASVNVEGTFTLTLLETTELRPLIQTTQTTAANRVVKGVSDSRLRVISTVTMPAGEPNNALTLRVNSLEDPPSVVARRTSTQSIPTNAITPVQFQAVEYDSMPGGQAQFVVGQDVFCRKTGWYWLNATWPWPTINVGALRTMYIYRNGTAAADIVAIDFRPATGGDTINNITIKKKFNAGDWFQMHVFQDTGASQASGILYGTYANLGLTWIHA